jgi:hypothetical protein
MTEAFYEPVGDGRFRPTQLTRGPWSHDAQHAGPPSGLLGRTMERAAGDSPGLIARITLEILRPVPVDALLEAHAAVVRGGRNVRLLSAVLDADAQPAMRASAWWVRTAEVGASAGIGGPAPPPPREGRTFGFFPGAADVGYHTAMDADFLEGAFTEMGPARVWIRMRHPLVAGEEPTPLVRVLVAADSGNGVSASLDIERFLFINADLTVALHRYPVGEWVHMTARTIAQPHGVGLADNLLSDEVGEIGRGLQTLFIAPRR